MNDSSKKRSRLLLVGSYVDGVSSSRATIFTSQISRVKHNIRNARHLELITRSGMRIRIEFDVVQEAWAWRATLFRRRTDFKSVLFVLDASIESVPHATQIDWADPFSYCRPSFLGFQDENNNNQNEDTTNKETDSELEDDDEEERVEYSERKIRCNSFDQNFGYAECRNACLKSKRNEDMALYMFGELPNNINKRYQVWILWDGHASWRCARLATCLYEDILRRELLRSFHDDKSSSIREKISNALSESFTKLDQKIFDISKKCENGIKGGAAMIVVFRCDRDVWIANAGDCKAVVANEDDTSLNVCRTHSVTNERRRLQRLAYENPKLLRGVFCRRLFEPPIGRTSFFYFIFLFLLFFFFHL
jgi:hypothetical protein